MLALSSKPWLRRLFRLGGGAVAVGLLAACGVGDSADLDGDEESAGLALESGEPLDPEVDDEVTRAPWEPIGFGVSYKSFGQRASRPNVMLVYGGYTAADEWVQRWANELLRVKG